MIVRATIAFLALPAVVGGLVPALIVGRAAPDHRTMVAGIVLLRTTRSLKR